MCPACHLPAESSLRSQLAQGLTFSAVSPEPWRWVQEDCWMTSFLSFFSPLTLFINKILGVKGSDSSVQWL